MSIAPVAHIASQGSRIRLDGGTLVVTQPDESSTHLQIGLIGGLVLLGAVEISTGAQLALADRGIACVFATRGGRVRGVLAPPSKIQSDRRQLQYELERERDASATATRPLVFAQRVVMEKIEAMLGIVTQHQRSHDDVHLTMPIRRMRRLLEGVQHAVSIDALRGYEGASAAQYFGCLPFLCRSELKTQFRSRRPPKDPINAALSLGYGLLVGELTATILARGLDPSLGVLHPPTDGRPSLALDLVEPLRHAIVDRLVLRAANRNELLQSDFVAVETDQGAGFHFTDTGRGKFLRLYQTAMGASISGAGANAGATPRDARWLISNAVEAYESTLGGKSVAPTLDLEVSESLLVP